MEQALYESYLKLWYNANSIVWSMCAAIPPGRTWWRLDWSSWLMALDLFRYNWFWDRLRAKIPWRYGSYWDSYHSGAYGATFSGSRRLGKCSLTLKLYELIELGLNHEFNIWSSWGFIDRRPFPFDRPNDRTDRLLGQSRPTAYRWPGNPADRPGAGLFSQNGHFSKV
jgi:hypothetical protein